MIAMALANGRFAHRRRPTTALDVTVQRRSGAAGRDSRAARHELLFITHDLGIVRRIADVVCVMNGGKIASRDRWSRSSPRRNTPTLAPCSPRSQSRTRPAPSESPVVISTDDLKSVSIKRGVLRNTVGHIKAVDGVSVSVRKGETLGVSGESGSGKTTLGLALLRLISSDGPIVFLGSNIQGLRFKAMRPFRRDMQIVFQDPFGALSRGCRSGILLPRASACISARFRKPNAKRADQGAQGCRHDRQRDPLPMSSPGGSASASASRARWCWSEFRGAGYHQRARYAVPAQMVDLLRELQRKRDLTYMFISHDLRVVLAASHLIVMRHGKVWRGSRRGAVQESEDRYTRALFARVPARDRERR